MQNYNCTILEAQLFERKTTDEIDDFIQKYNYQVTERTIILACYRKIEFLRIKHLTSFKITFTENGVDEIINLYEKNGNINQLLFEIKKYYNFTQDNYDKMAHCICFKDIFHDVVLKNDIIDDNMTDLILKYGLYIEHHNMFFTKFFVEEFLDSIRDLASKNEENKNNILALYCFAGYIHGISKFKKDFKCKLTTKCLKFVFIRNKNCNKPLMNLFKKDKVKPTLDVFKQYAKTYKVKREQQYLIDLLDD